MLTDLRCADAKDQRAFVFGIAADRDDVSFGEGIGKRVKPDMLGSGITPASMPCLAIAVGGVGHAPQGQGFRDSRDDSVLPMRRGGKGTCAPADAGLLNGKTPADRDRRSAAIGIFQLIFRNQAAQFVAGKVAGKLSRFRDIRQVRRQRLRLVFDDMGEDEISRAQFVQGNAHGVRIEQDDIRLVRSAKFKGDAATRLMTESVRELKAQHLIERGAVAIVCA